MKYISKILEIILNIIIILMSIVVIFAATYVVQTRVMKKDYANIFGYTGFEVITGSMSGTIEIGDVVIVKIDDSIEENDIIVYRQEDDFITHRVVNINGDTLTTKGDANNSEDRQIDIKQVLGKVIYIIPKVSIWKKVMSTPVVSISIITTILLFGLAFSYETKEPKDE